MTTVRDLLRDADPLRHEPHWTVQDRDLLRQAVVAAASDVMIPSPDRLRAPIAILAIVTVAVIATAIVGSQIWSQATVNLEAAVRFEVKLAEDNPAPGLLEARVLASGRALFLHPEVIVANGDIERARLIQGDGPLRFSVGVEFNAVGAQKMRAATANHVGKPVAILINGEVVMAPVVRSPIGTSAVITGDQTRAEAERIVNGIIGR